MADRDPSAARRIGSAFLAGLTRPSLFGVVGSALVCVAWISFACANLTERRVAELEVPLRLRDGFDPYLTATQLALRARFERPRPRAVAIFGASAQMNAFGTSAEVTRLFTATAGVPVPVDVACAPGISLPEMAVQVRASKRGYPGAIVIGVTPMKVGQPGELNRELVCLGLVEPPLATGVYLVDQRAFLAPRLEHALVRWLQYRLPVIGRPVPPPPRRWPAGVAPYPEARYARELPSRAERVDRNLGRLTDAGSGLAVLEALVAELRDEGRVVVLLESLLNPRLLEAIDAEAWAAYVALMERVAADHGAHYWDLREPARLTREDFWDIGHVGSTAGRRRYSQALADRLVPLVLAADAEAGR